MPRLKNGFIDGLVEMLGKESPADVRAAAMHFIGAVSQELLKPINVGWKETLVEALTTLAASKAIEKETLLCAMAGVTLIQLGAANYSNTKWSAPAESQLGKLLAPFGGEDDSRCAATTITASLAAAAEPATAVAAASEPATSEPAAVEPAATEPAAAEPTASLATSAIVAATVAPAPATAATEPAAAAEPTVAFSLGSIFVVVPASTRPKNGDGAAVDDAEEEAAEEADSKVAEPAASVNVEVMVAEVDKAMKEKDARRWKTLGALHVRSLLLDRSVLNPPIATLQPIDNIYSINAGICTKVSGIRIRQHGGSSRKETSVLESSVRKVTEFTVAYSPDESVNIKTKWSDVDSGVKFMDTSGMTSGSFDALFATPVEAQHIRITVIPIDTHRQLTSSMRAGLLVNLTMEAKRLEKKEKDAKVAKDAKDAEDAEATEAQRKKELIEAAWLSLSGRAVELRSSDSIRLGRTGPQELGLAGGESWTIELWVRVDSITPGGSNESVQTVFGINDYGTGKGLHCVFCHGKLILNLYGGGPIDPTPIDVNVWTHFALQFEKQHPETQPNASETQPNASDVTNLQGNLRIFRNGIEVAASRSNPFVGNVDLFLGFRLCGRPLLGTETGNATANLACAQVRLWNVALPANMIGARMYT